MSVASTVRIDNNVIYHMMLSIARPGAPAVGKRGEAGWANHPTAHAPEPPQAQALPLELLPRPTRAEPVRAIEPPAVDTGSRRPVCVAAAEAIAGLDLLGYVTVGPGALVVQQFAAAHERKRRNVQTVLSDMTQLRAVTAGAERLRAGFRALRTGLEAAECFPAGCWTDTAGHAPLREAWRQEVAAVLEEFEVQVKKLNSRTSTLQLYRLVLVLVAVGDDPHLGFALWNAFLSAYRGRRACGLAEAQPDGVVATRCLRKGAEVGVLAGEVWPEEEPLPVGDVDVFPAGRVNVVCRPDLLSRIEDPHQGPCGDPDCTAANVEFVETPLSASDDFFGEGLTDDRSHTVICVACRDVPGGHRLHAHFGDDYDWTGA